MMTAARLAAPSLAARRARRAAPVGALRAGRPARRCTSSVARRSGRAGPRPRSRRFRRPRRQRRARSAEASGRPTTPMQIALLVDNSAAARNDIRDIREAAHRVRQRRVDRRRTASNEVALIALGERPTILADYTTDRAELLKGVGRIFAQRAERRLPARRHHRDVSQGFKKREAAAAGRSSRSRRKGPEFSNRYHDQVLDAAARRRAPRSTSSWSAGRRRPDAHEGRESRYRARQGTRSDRRALRQPAGRARRSADRLKQARRRADASVPRHLRAAAVADSARAASPSPPRSPG